MNPYDLLSPVIRKYVYDKGWKKLTSIQAAAIQNILNTEFNFILSSKTASGKTEAVLLPTLSNLNDSNGIKILYISPLIALINDQFERIERLCEYLDIPVTKWHGEASISLKKKLIANPQGILLITPESLEAIFVNKPELMLKLFSNLQYLVVDEIHSFLNTKRGIQLKSIIHRIENKIKRKIRFFGLSATLGDYKLVKDFTGDPDNTKILLDKSQKNVLSEFKYFESPAHVLPLELIVDLYSNVSTKKTLIFPNSRGKVEEISIKLKRLSEQNSGHQNYFAHHSSVSKELRVFAEKFAKETKDKYFSIVCTNTLELGIDIGCVDLICQINSTYSVSSLAQRFGRSGRGEDLISHLLLYATDEWHLLQATACFELYKDSVIEPLEPIRYPIDIMLHQIFSILKETNGITKSNLIHELVNNYAFRKINEADIKLLIDNMISEDYIELVGGELILGLKAEKFFIKGEFYAVFETDKNFSVYHKEKLIGELQQIDDSMIDSNVYLAAKIWKIKEIDYTKMKVFVDQAFDGKEPIYVSSLPDVSHIIREKMLHILCSKETYDYMDENSLDTMNGMRKFFSFFNLTDLSIDRPLFIKDGLLYFYTFSSSKINRTLQFFSKLTGDNFGLTEITSCLISNGKSEMFSKSLAKFLGLYNELDSHFDNFLKDNTKFFEGMKKWEELLPLPLKKKIWLMNYLDLEGTKNYLSKVKIRASIFNE